MWCAYERLSCLSLSLSSPPDCSPKEFAESAFDFTKLEQDSILNLAGSYQAPAVSPLQCRPTVNYIAASADSPAPCTPGRKRRRSVMSGLGSARLSKASDGSASTPTFGSPPPVRVPLSDREPMQVSTPRQQVAPQTPQTQRAFEAVQPAPAWTPQVSGVSQLLSRLSPRRLLSSSPLGLQFAGQSHEIPDAATGAVPSTSSSNSLASAHRRVAAQETAFASRLQILGEALHSLHRFSCKEALVALDSLPESERRSAFVQDLEARCHFELSNYAEAVRIYGRCCKEHKLYKPVGLEYYSTALWHLQDKLELGNLSRQVLEWDRQRPQVWCVVGNCFSLQKQHEQAIRCFRRAIQLDPTFAYAHNLIGHELMAEENYDKAVHMYQQAIALDHRSYNAWWGLGNVYQRQEDFAKAKYNFHHAVQINACNDVLLISLGIAFQATGETQRALRAFSKVESQHCGALASLQKGCALQSLGQHTEAVDELKRAQGLAPREPSVHFQLGKAHVGAGNRREALIHFSKAMSLSSSEKSRDHHLIESAQEELRKALGEDDDMSFKSPGNYARRRRQS